MCRFQKQLEVRFDGVQTATVCIGEHEPGQMTGMCGNCDGDRFNDIDEAVKEKSDRWRVVDEEQPE